MTTSPSLSWNSWKGNRSLDLIPHGGLPIEDVVRYGTQIADALAHAHLGGVTHRDLKSANVLMTRDGRPKVLDFGLARALSRETLDDLSQSRASITADGVDRRHAVGDGARDSAR